MNKQILTLNFTDMDGEQVSPFFITYWNNTILQALENKRLKQQLAHLITERHNELIQGLSEGMKQDIHQAIQQALQPANQEMMQMMEDVKTDTTFLKGRFTTPTSKKVPTKKRVTKAERISDIELRLMTRRKKVVV
jgi:hypothetical protein